MSCRIATIINSSLGEHVLISCVNRKYLDLLWITPWFKEFKLIIPLPAQSYNLQLHFLRFPELRVEAGCDHRFMGNFKNLFGEFALEILIMIILESTTSCWLNIVVKTYPISHSLKKAKLLLIQRVYHYICVTCCF